VPDSVAPEGRYDWRINAALFVLTVVSVFVTGQMMVEPPQGSTLGEVAIQAVYNLPRAYVGWIFAVPLLGILLAHEFGHWIAARIHGVPASLPYFLPLPLFSPFGTLGAVIAMPRRIRSRNALLDIGAAGPLAGMVVAIPVIVIGLSLSPVLPPESDTFIQEGQSLLYMLLKFLVLGPIPVDHDVRLHPTAFAGWAGFLVTMINLLPWGQLDGGHIAYALFGPVQNRLARLFRLMLLPLFFYNLATFLIPVLRGTSRMSLETAVTNSMFWFTWFLMLGFIAWLTKSDEHPPTEDATLSPVRRAIAIFSLLLFVALFMPTPIAQY
jgi:membrane-associated protease RseP (regulator of RpoE activity)